MPVTNVVTDAENLTINLTAEFAAPLERVWQAYTDPRQLERFWGPPTWPATFTEFDLRAGGIAKYEMVGPNGERSRGGWEFISIDNQARLEMLDMFYSEDGTPDTSMPSMRMTYAFESVDGGTRVTNVTYFDSVESLETVLSMGVIEGSTLAINQLDAVLHDLRDYAQGKGTRTELLSDTLVRVTRLIDGPRDLVWRAHTEPDLIRQWMLGPDGWEITLCEVARAVGEVSRTAWAPVGETEGEPFGFESELLYVDAPNRLVETQRMMGMDGPTTTNDLLLYEEDGSTLITLVLGYPSKELRDEILGTGMTEGMEASYARLEGVLRGM